MSEVYENNVKEFPIKQNVFWSGKYQSNTRHCFMSQNIMFITTVVRDSNPKLRANYLPFEAKG